MLPTAASEQYRLQQSIATVTTATVARLWRRMDDDFDSSWARIRPGILTALQTGRSTAVARALDYTGAVVDELGLGTPPVADLVPARFLATTPDGRTVEGLADQAVVHAKLRVAGGAAPSEALASARTFLTTSALTLLADTRRDVYQADMISRPQLTGYVRMLNPPSCSRCAILAGKWFRWNTGFQRHPKCDCQHIPSREDTAGSLLTDPYEYFRSLSPTDQDRIFSKAGAQAVRDGGDIYRVTNVRMRGLSTSKQAIRYGTPSRFTIDDVYRLAGDDRGRAIELMRAEGYITGPQVRGGNIVGRFRESYQTPISRPIVPGSKRDRVLRARSTGVRDPLDRATMTAAERRLFDASYRLEYARKYGYLPRSIGTNSADLHSGLVGLPATPERMARLEGELQRQLARIPKGESGMRRLADVLVGKDDFESRQIFDRIEHRVGIESLRRGRPASAAGGGGGRIPPRRGAGAAADGEPNWTNREHLSWDERRTALGIDFGGEAVGEHEIRFLERFTLDLGNEIRWIPRPAPRDRFGRPPSNDFLWIAEGVEIELKRRDPRFDPPGTLTPPIPAVRRQIAKAARSALEHRHSLVKGHFIVDLDDRVLSDELRAALASFNADVRRGEFYSPPISRIWVMHRDRFEEIDLL